eukprot:448614-Heterocapsa_arctica.AAC.1
MFQFNYDILSTWSRRRVCVEKYEAKLDLWITELCVRRAQLTARLTSLWSPELCVRGVRRAASRQSQAAVGGGDGRQRSAGPRATPRGRLGGRRTGAGG